MQKDIDFNRNIHDKIAPLYQNQHSEIFNDIEQNRLSEKICNLKNILVGSSNYLKALDIGCGTGNITNHLLNVGFYVFSADISPNFLSIIRKRFNETKMSSTILLNGSDLKNIDADSFDLVTAYSVLHHIPDYLAMIKEMIRVTKKGGIIFIDHEVNETYWQQDQSYIEYRKLTDKTIFTNNFFRLATFKKAIHKIFNPKFQTEGDIHVWPDDHIEWSKIENIFNINNCDIILKEDYLNFKGTYPIELYYHYKNIFKDMRLMVAKKNN